jgi:UDP-glucose 4,6-dehydratase
MDTRVGFIGSHVAILLCKKYPQYNIVVYDKLDYCACYANLEEISDLPNFKFVKGDIASPDLVSYVLREEKIDTILHFAAQTHVDNSFGNSFAFTECNIYGTHVLLESAKCCATLKRFVHVSTDEVYGEGENFETDPMSEEHVLEPTNPYAATKAGAEFLVKSYFRSFKLPCLITRGNNVYGPHQFPEKLIPKLTNQLMRDIPLTIHGDGSNTRNFLYVKDVATAFDIIMHKGTPGHVYNIGGRNEVPNIEVARQLLKLFGKEKEEDKMIVLVPDRKFNDLRYTINSTKLHELGWTEDMPWEEGLRTTVDWYKEFTYRYGNIDAALVAHPRMLNTMADGIDEPIQKQIMAPRK